MVLHTVYNLLLIESYRDADFNQVYPIARGTAPPTVAVAAVLVVGESLAPLQVVGLLGVSGGLLALAGGRRRGSRRALAFAVLTGLLIASYTVVDGVGVRRAGSVPGYATWLFTGNGLLTVLALLATARRSGRACASRAGRIPSGLITRGVVAGALSLAAYGLVLWAQTRDALAVVAALQRDQRRVRRDPGRGGIPRANAVAAHTGQRRDRRRGGRPRARLSVVRHIAQQTSQATEEATMDWKLELVAVPVSDVDRAKAFYVEQVGFNADHDQVVSDEMRFVQLTPPGSACSIAFGQGIIDTEPGSLGGLQLVVDDVHAARAELAQRGVEVSEVQDFPWGSFVFFSDPDGNRWSVQQVPAWTAG